MTPDGTLTRDYLKRHCPIAWNTPERQDTYARLGYDVIGEAFRLISDALGKEGAIKPAHLPVKLAMRFSIVAGEGAPTVRVAKRQDAEPETDPDGTPCGAGEDKPTLTAQYLDEHAVTTWDEESMRFAYATMGYAVERQLVHALIEEGGVDAEEATRAVPVTIDTTWTAGGCAVACSGGNCVHKERN